MECYLSPLEYNEYVERESNNKLFSKESERGCFYYGKDRAFESSLDEMYTPAVVKYKFFAQMQQPIFFDYGQIRLQLKPFGDVPESFVQNEKHLFTLEARDHNFSDQIIEQCKAGNGSCVELHVESFVACFQACHQSAIESHGACLSFSVCPAYPQGRQCRLSSQTFKIETESKPQASMANEMGQFNVLNSQFLQESSGCRVYRLNALQMFAVHRGLQIHEKTSKALKLTNVLNEENCAMVCIQSKIGCLTFEFSETKSQSDVESQRRTQCVLYPMHVYELFSDEKFSSYLSENSLGRLYSGKRVFFPFCLQKTKFN